MNRLGGQKKDQTLRAFHIVRFSPSTLSFIMSSSSASNVPKARTVWKRGLQQLPALSLKLNFEILPRNILLPELPACSMTPSTRGQALLAAFGLHREVVVAQKKEKKKKRERRRHTKYEQLQNSPEEWGEVSSHPEVVLLPGSA